MRRGLWFSAGVAAGAYGVVRVRRLAEAFTPEGLRDRLTALAAGARVFGDEVRAGMSEKEVELRERMSVMVQGPPDGNGPTLQSSQKRTERELT